MSELTKGYKAQGTLDYTNFHHAQLTHPPSTNSMPEPSSSKKKKLSITQALFVSQEKIRATHTSQLGSRIDQYSEICMPIACLSTTRSMPIYRLE